MEQHASPAHPHTPPPEPNAPLDAPDTRASAPNAPDSLASSSDSPTISASPPSVSAPNAPNISASPLPTPAPDTPNTSASPPPASPPPPAPPPNAPNTSAPASPPIRRLLSWRVLLGLVLLIAIALRVVGLAWDDGFGHTPHPDERAVLGVVERISAPSPGKLSLLFDAEQSTWNPRWFNYGSFPIYVLNGVQAASSALFGDNADVRVLARLVSAAADVATVLAVFALGASVFDRRVGLLAAAFTAFAVLHIQLSHFFTVDTVQALLAVAALFFMVRIALYGRLWDSVAAGILVGLGLATKASQLPIIAPFAAAHLIFLFALNGKPTHIPYTLRQRAALHGGIAGVASAVLVLVLAQPYTFLDWSTFFSHVSEQSELARGIRDYPYTRQYADTLPYLYHIRQLTLWGYGAPLGIAAWGGLLFVSLWGMPLRAGLLYLAIGWGLPIAILLVSHNFLAVAAAAGISLLALLATLPLRSDRARLPVLLLCWVVPYFIVTGSFHMKFMRYLLPIAPLLSLFGAQLLIALWHKAKTLSPKPHLRRFVGIVIGLVLAATAFYTLAYINGIYGNAHTAVRSAEWLNHNAHDGSFILKEHWEESLPYLRSDFSFFDLPLYEDDTPSKIELVSHMLAQADYLVFFSNRLYGTIPRLPERYPITAQYYRLLFAGELGYDLANVETAYPQLLGVTFVDDTFSRPSLPPPAWLDNTSVSPITLDLGFADESFSVYDHPKVLIFRNERRLAAPDIRSRIESAALSAASTEPHDQSPEIGLMYSPQHLAIQQSGGTWTDIIRPNTWSSRLPVLGWLAVLEIMGLAALPLTFLLFRSLPDRGFLFTKTLGILLIGLLVWLMASLQWLGFSRTVVVLGILLMAGISAPILAFNWRQILHFLRKRWSLILAGELIFLAAFLAFMLIRMANPDLWHPFRGGEKPMDFAYLNAVLRSTIMPPYDPWFGGGYINYYYWGQFLTAMLIRATSIEPTIAFNLAVPTFFALTVCGAYSIVYNLTASAANPLGILNTARTAAQNSLQHRLRIRIRRISPMLAGGVGALFVAVLGNLDGAIQVGHGLKRSLQGEPMGEFDFWKSSRMMPPDPPGFEITEFPFFTFLFADLHAHLMAIPFTLLAVGIALAIVLAARHPRPDNPPAQTPFTLGAVLRWAQSAAFSIGTLRLLILGIAVGSLRLLNAWDLPTYMMVAAASILLAEYLMHGGVGLVVLGRAAAKTIIVALMGFVAFLPYHLSYESFYNSLQSTTNTTTLWQFLAISGVSIFIIGSFVVDALADSARRGMGAFVRRFAILRSILDGGHTSADSIVSPKWLVGVLAAALLVGFALTLSFTGVVGSTVPFVLALSLLVLFVGLASSSKPDAPQLGFVLALALISFGLVIGLDFFRVDGDIERQNSIFKFYLQVWVMLAIASAYLLWRLLNTAASHLSAMPWLRHAWRGMLILLIVSAAIYPILGTQDRLRDRFDGNTTLPLTLDGAAYIQQAMYRDHSGEFIDLANDYEGIEWLKQNVSGSPIILEAVTPTYRWGGRVSIYTGLPSVVGWQWHQEQQRWGYRHEVAKRIHDVQTIYDTPNPQEALALMHKYGVKYVYLGQLERIYSDPAGMNKFHDALTHHLEKVFDNGNTVIYRLIE